MDRAEMRLRAINRTPIETALKAICYCLERGSMACAWWIVRASEGSGYYCCLECEIGSIEFPNPCAQVIFTQLQGGFDYLPQVITIGDHVLDNSEGIKE